MTTEERAKEIWERTAWGAVGGATSEESERRLAAAITEAEAAAADAALQAAAAVLRRTGSRNAAKMVEALLEDSRAVRAGKATQFPALRDAVPLLASSSGRR